MSAFWMKELYHVPTGTNKPPLQDFSNWCLDKMPWAKDLLEKAYNWEANYNLSREGMSRIERNYADIVEFKAWILNSISNAINDACNSLGNGPMPPEWSDTVGKALEEATKQISGIISLNIFNI